MDQLVPMTVLSTFLCGCAVSSTAPSFSEAPAPNLNRDKAVLYIYRQYAEPTAWSAYLLMEDQELVSLPQQGFSWVYVNPGKHHFTFKWPWLASMPTVEFDREFEKNKVYVFEMQGRTAMTGVGVGVVHFRTESEISPTAPEVAKSAMTACCRYVRPTIQNE